MVSLKLRGTARKKSTILGPKIVPQYFEGACVCCHSRYNNWRKNQLFGHHCPNLRSKVTLFGNHFLSVGIWGGRGVILYLCSPTSWKSSRCIYLVHIYMYLMKLSHMSFFIKSMAYKWHTLPETNIAPENGWLEYYFPIGEAYFQGLR